MDAILLDAIRELVRDLADGRFAAIEADGRAGRLTADELQTALREYGRTLVPLPDETDGLIEVFPRNNDPNTWSLDVTLWTSEEGRSDLTLQVDATKQGVDYRLTITALHVL